MASQLASQPPNQPAVPLPLNVFPCVDKKAGPLTKDVQGGRYREAVTAEELRRHSRTPGLACGAQGVAKPQKPQEPREMTQ